MTTDTSSYITPFARLDEKIIYDDSVLKSETFEIPCSKTTQATLNQPQSQLRFSYNGDQTYRLSSPKTGFLLKYAFKTRIGNANNMNAEITLASNFFSYLFNQAQLSIGGQVTELIRFPGIVSDIFYNFQETEFRNHSGESVTYIPDNSTLPSCTIGNRQGDVQGGDVNAVLVSVNLNANKIIKSNHNYNHGYDRRKQLYNYTVANDNDFRFGEIFVPLNRIFGFCDEYDRVLKYIGFDVELIRTANNTNIMFGIADTNIQFGDVPDSGILSLSLLLEQITFKPDVTVQLEQMYANPIEVAYLKRICEEHATIDIASTFSYTKTMTALDEGCPRYIFCVFKNSVDDTPQLNSQLCSHANISSITVTYGGQQYPNLPHNENWTRNEYARFYHDFIEVGRSIGLLNPGLSMTEFKNLFTVYCIDLSAHPQVSTTSQITISVTRRTVPVDADATTQNPRSIKGYFIYVAESKLEINCVKRTIRRM